MHPSNGAVSTLLRLASSVLNSLPAVEAVNYRKKQIIRHVAQFYMATRYKSCDIPCRFDVIGIDGETVTHIKNAF